MNSDTHALLAPYALDALDPDERARFEAHLDECEECASELAGFVETATKLGGVHEVATPVEMRARLMDAVARTPQERPVVSALTPRGRAGRLLPKMVVAASLVLALAGGGAFLVERSNNAEMRAQQNLMTSVMSAPDASMDSMELPDGGSIRLIHSASEHAAVLVTSQMPRLTDETYQLWSLKDGHATSQGLISDVDTTQMVMKTDGAQALAITVEPEGGSEQPTSDPIMTVEM